jgi:hypothetical protein
MGVMARVNVPGTPFEGMEEISTERMLQILATMRLCVGTKVRCTSIHPAIPEALYAGASSFTVERGANPRDTDFNEGVWRGFSAAEAVKLIEEAGFECRPADYDPRFVPGKEAWWKKGNPLDYVMPNPLEGGNCCGANAKKNAI